VIFGLHVYYVVTPSYKTSLELGNETLAIAEREKSPMLRVQGLLTHGMTHFWQGDVELGVAALEEGISIYDEQRQAMFGKTPLFDHGVGCRRYQAVLLWLQGYPDKAGQRAAEALADVRRIDQPLTIASTLAFVSMMHCFRRDAEATRAAAAEAVACTREYVLTFWLGFAGALQAWSIAQLSAASARPASDWERGISEIRESLDAHLSAGARTFRTIGLGLLADAYLLRSRLDDADAAAIEGIAVAGETDERVWEAELHRLRGECARARGATQEAQRHFDRAVGVAREKREKSLELRALVSSYRLARAEGEGVETRQRREELARTYGWFREGFDSSDLQAARALLE